MWFPIVILILLHSPPSDMPAHSLRVGGPLEGFESLSACMAFAQAMAPRSLMEQLRRDPDEEWAIHSVGCAHNPTQEG
jgi:hypothetical protein